MASSSESSSVVEVNSNAVASTINYYGHGLLTSLADNKSHLLPYDAMKNIDYHSFKSRSEKLQDTTEVKQYGAAVQFVLSSADLLFTKFPKPERKEEEYGSKYGCKDKYSYIPPLEYYLLASKKMRLTRFTKGVRRGDLLICRSNSSTNRSSQSVKVICYDGGPHLLLSKGLSINVTLDLTKTRVPIADESNISGTWAANTLLRVEVLSVKRDDNNADITVGTLGETLEEGNSITLGKIGRSEVPAIINGVESYTRESIGSFDSCLRNMETFKNPRAIQHLAKHLGIRTTNSSLMPTLRHKFEDNEYYLKLRKSQLSLWAHKHVAEGVAHFRQGEHTEAFQLLEKALSIDSENVEAFVAKGALLANLEKYEKAIELFEKGLKYNPDHANARKYICETLLALGKRYEEEMKLGAAESCYLKCLNINPEHSGCYGALSTLHSKAGFTSTITKEMLINMDPNNEKKVSESVAANDLKSPLEKQVSQDEDIILATEELESRLTDNPRDKSLSPLGQKLALQNNAWHPPSNIKTTESFMDQSPSVTHSTNKQPHSSDIESHANKEKRNPVVKKFTINKAPTITPVGNNESSQHADETSALPELTDEPPPAIVIPQSTVSQPTTPSNNKDNSELDESYNNVMKLHPTDQEDIAAMSMSLVILAKRYKKIGNNIRARLCIEKSLKHNPHHASTLKILNELEEGDSKRNASPPAPATIPTLSSVTMTPATYNASMYQQSSYPEYNYMYGPPPQQPVSYSGFNYPPPNMYGMNYPPPYYGQQAFVDSSSSQHPSWGSTETVSNIEQDYDAQVNSFLLKINSGRKSSKSPSEHRNVSQSSQRSPSPRASIRDFSPTRSRSPRRSRSRHGRRRTSSRSSSRDRDRRKNRRSKSISKTRSLIQKEHSRSPKKKKVSDGGFSPGPRKMSKGSVCPSPKRSKMWSVSPKRCPEKQDVVDTKAKSKIHVKPPDVTSSKKSDGKASRKKKRRSVSSSSSHSSSGYSPRSKSRNSLSNSSNSSTPSEKAKPKKKKHSKKKIKMEDDELLKNLKCDPEILKALKERLKKTVKEEDQPKKKPKSKSPSTDKSVKKDKVKKSEKKNKESVKADSPKLPVKKSGKVPEKEVKQIDTKVATVESKKPKKKDETPIEKKKPNTDKSIVEIEKIAQKDTNLDLNKLLNMPGLEALQDKIKNYYSIVNQTKTTNKEPEKSKVKNIAPSVVPSGITAQKHPEENKVGQKSILPGNSSAKISFDLKKTKPTFKPSLKALDNPEDDGFNADQFLRTVDKFCILTPKELPRKAEIIKEYSNIIDKAKKTAEAISKNLERGGRSARSRSRSKSHNRYGRPKAPSRLRNRSHSRGSRSISRGRYTRSRSRDRRSRSYDRRSRSKSLDRQPRYRSSRRRSRSRSNDRHLTFRRRQSRSRSPKRHSVSRSRSRSRGRGRRSRSPKGFSRSRSRSRGYVPHNPRLQNLSAPRGGRQRPQRGDRSASPPNIRKADSPRRRRTPDNAPNTNTPGIDAMFGKWIDEESKTNNTLESKNLNEMEGGRAKKPFMPF